MVLYLKEHRQIALHVACGDITDVELSGSDFIIHIEDGMLQNLLNEGKREIESALRWQGLDLNVIFSVKTIELSPEEQDIKTLKSLFGEKLVIKGDK